MPKPLLILSDDVSCTSGLARITRDLATRITKHLPDLYRVATLGYGGSGSSKLPWMQYHITDIADWLVRELPEVWEDFAGNEPGVVLTIWDPSRLRWLLRPETCIVPGIRDWIVRGNFERWGYLPIDASGPNSKLSGILGDTIKGYDRVICYSQWAEDIVRRTIGEDESRRLRLTNLPHGIDSSAWVQHPKAEAKRRFRQSGFTTLSDDAFLVGIVATNQPRKDFGLGFEVCAELMNRGLDVYLWIHTDAMQRAWNLQALTGDFGLLRRVMITTDTLPDQAMNSMYSACDVTLGIGAGEGFGYPIFESLASGTYCVHGNYGGAAEHMPSSMLVDARWHRYEGQFDCMRPVFKARSWADSALLYDYPVKLPDHLDWPNLWPKWEQWFRQ